MESVINSPRHTISVYQVSRILLGARKQRVDINQLLIASGISPDVMHQPRARVTQAQYNRLMVLLCRRLRDEFLGLCSEPLAPGSFATCCRLVAHAETLGQAIRTGFRYFHQCLVDFVPRLRVKDGIAYWELHDRQPLDKETMYAKRVFLYFGYGLACWLTEKQIPLLKVFYARDEMVIPTEAKQLFQAPVEFGSGPVGYCFDAQWLDTPVLQNGESVERYLRRIPANMLVRYRDKSTLTERVRRLVRHELSSAALSFEQVAQDLRMTPQTLRRRLIAEGKGFQTIKNELRRDAAIELLSDPTVRMSDVASRVGFSELATFYRAFREWTGMTPGMFRRRIR